MIDSVINSPSYKVRSMNKLPIKAMALIPARYGSTRLNAKALALINGKPMIEHVYTNMSKGSFEVAVVTDHHEIEKCILNIGGKVFRVDDDVQTGSERIGLALDRYLKNQNYDFIVNVQGDEPLLKANSIDRLLQFHAQSQFDVTTLYYPRVGGEDLLNPNCVKLVTDQKSGKCLYFSRSAIPYYREDSDKNSWKWFQHVGVYCFKPDALKKFLSLPIGVLERAESLEQLRMLEAAMLLGATQIDQLPQSVDTQEDLKKVEKILNSNKE